MAYVTGTATNHVDLYDKLIDFLKNNPALVSAGQNWTEVWTGAANGERVLSGPGISGTDSVLVGLALLQDVPNNRYRIRLRGMTGILPSAITLAEHVNVSAAYGFYADSGPMTYWFIANGRRFMVVVKISTVFESCYAGLYLPYSLPANYPYPLFIGGTFGPIEGGSLDWRAVNDEHSNFAYPYKPGGLSSSPSNSAAIIDPLGQWLQAGNYSSLTPPHVCIGPEDFGDALLGVSRVTDSSSMGYDTLRQRTREYFGGGYALTPLTITQDTPQNQTYGVLQGAYHVPGEGNSSENIITVGGVDHLVVQNIFRTTTGNFIAVALE